MKNNEFAEKLVSIANVKTTYVLGGWGQALTASKKLFFKALYPKNRNSATIASGIDKADANTYAFDCNCLVKSVINGWDNGKINTHKPIEDNVANIAWMLAQCTEKSEDMSQIEIGEYLVYGDFSHCGVYVGVIDGKRTAVESTYRWANGVQLIDIDRAERKNMWKYHGKLSQWVEYPTDATIHAAELTVEADKLLMVKNGAQSRYVRYVQNCLVDQGYTYVDPCGYFGDDTEKAIKDLQNKSGITADGVVGFDTINALIKGA